MGRDVLGQETLHLARNPLCISPLFLSHLVQPDSIQLTLLITCIHSSGSWQAVAQSHVQAILPRAA